MTRSLIRGPRYVLAAALGAAAALLFAAAPASNPAQAHPAGACYPKIVAPGAGATTSLRPKIQAKFSGHKNCQINRIGLEIRHVSSGNMIVDKTWNCCNVLTSLRNTVDFKVPAGELRPGTDYKVTVEYFDKHAVTVNDLKVQSVRFRTASRSGGSGSGNGGSSSGGGNNASQPSPSATRARYVSIEPDTGRPGSDYRDFTMTSPDPNRCAEMCEEDSKCRAYTYVAPGRQGPDARCWLKDSVPDPILAKGNVSGVKHSPLPQTFNIDRPGQDYTDFRLDEAEPIRCAKACADDSRCEAYTYVPPGRQGPYPRCWLKDGVPSRQANDGLVSGVKE